MFLKQDNRYYSVIIVCEYFTVQRCFTWQNFQLKSTTYHKISLCMSFCCWHASGIPVFLLHFAISTKTSKFRELWSPARQQIWPWRRSKVTVKVTTWYHRKGLVTRNTHAEYQSSICNSAKVMAKVKVFVTDGQTDRQTEGRMRFNVPTLSRKRGTMRQRQFAPHWVLTPFMHFKQWKDEISATFITCILRHCNIIC